MMNHNGNNLRAVMARKGVSEMELAERLGVHHKCVTQYKRAVKWRLPTMRRIASALKCTQKELRGE